jgi:uncharacterized protein (TIGR02757 family)
MAEKNLKVALEGLYQRYARPAFIPPDPLQFVHLYADPLDREVVGLIASCLAYGNVRQILRSVRSVLGQMGPSPAAFVRRTDAKGLEGTFADFKHRFTTGAELSALLTHVRTVLATYGSLAECFLHGRRRESSAQVQSATSFVSSLAGGTDPRRWSLLSSPAHGSACKRLHLFLRWMVRCDSVDPGGWPLSAKSLTVPLDTHMHRVALALGLTSRKQADRRAAEEVTEAFRRIAPEDPVRYDFALTRPGIRGEVCRLHHILHGGNCRLRCIRRPAAGRRQPCRPAPQAEVN